MVKLSTSLRQIMLLMILTSSQKGRADRLTVIKKMICSYVNPLYLKINYCRFVPIDSDTVSGNFTVDVTLVRSMDNIKVQVKEYLKKGKKFEPTLLDFNYNLCDLTRNFNSTQSQLIQELYEKWTPNTLDKFRNLLHPCPYSGTIFYSKITNVVRHPGPTALLYALGSVKHVANIYINDQIAFSLVTYKLTKIVEE